MPVFGNIGSLGSVGFHRFCFVSALMFHRFLVRWIHKLHFRTMCCDLIFWCVIVPVHVGGTRYAFSAKKKSGDVTNEHFKFCHIILYCWQRLSGQQFPFFYLVFFSVESVVFRSVESENTRVAVVGLRGPPEQISSVLLCCVLSVVWGRNVAVGSRTKVQVQVYE